MVQEQDEPELQIIKLQVYILYITNLLRSYFKQENTITLTQYRILSMLQIHDCMLRTSDLALFLHVSPGTISTNASTLASRGLLHRSDGFDSFHLMTVSITEPGHKLLNELNVNIDYIFDNILFSPIGEYLSKMAVRIAARNVAYLLENRNNAYDASSAFIITESCLLFDDHLKKLCHSHDLTILEYCLLYILNEGCSDDKLSGVAADLLVSSSHLAAAVRSLTRRSYIIRQRSNVDHRVFSLDLTTTGFAVMEQISSDFRTWMPHSPEEHMAASKIVRLNLGNLRSQNKASVS